MSIRQSNSVSPTRYIGTVCQKHPELKGERRKKTYVCVGCQRDRNKQYRATSAGRESHNEAVKQAYANQAYARKILQSRLAKVKAMAIQMARDAGAASDWASYYQRALDECRVQGIMPPVNT